MDVLDFTDRHFFYRHFSHDLRNAGLGVDFAHRRASRVSYDPDDARNKIFSGVVGQCLYTSCLDGNYRFEIVDRVYYFSWLDDYRYALGVMMIEYF